MKRPATLVLLAVSFTCSTVLASLYSWNPEKRPPISLSDALARAEKLLGDDARNRYCVAVHLYGDETGLGKEGAWNMYFAAADGSKKHVYINMQGKSDVHLWHAPIDWTKNDGRREDLADIRKRLEELFKRESMVPDFELKDDTLRVTLLPREFEVYPEGKRGQYAEKLQKVTGPEPRGFWLEIRKVAAPDQREYGYDGGPYWRWVRGTYLSNRKDEYFAVDFRYGHELKYDVSNQMCQIFGKPSQR